MYEIYVEYSDRNTVHTKYIADNVLAKWILQLGSSFQK